MDAVGGDGGGEKLIHICEKTGHDAAAAPVLLLKTGKSYPPEFSARSIKPKRAQHSVFFQGWILCNKRKQAGEIPACFPILKDKNR